MKAFRRAGVTALPAVPCMLTIAAEGRPARAADTARSGRG